MHSQRHPEHCQAECSAGAGPSSPKMQKRRRPRQRATRAMSLLAALACSFAAGTMANPIRDVASSLPAHTQRSAPASFGELIQRRQALVEREGASSTTSFDVGVTPPTTCEQMNITFSTHGGKPPYTIFIGFDNWYAYTVSLPATYADADVDTWMYPFDVPTFDLKSTNSQPNPVNFVAVGDSTGALLNTSTFQTVTVSGKTCAPVSGKNDFYFYTDNDLIVCQGLGIYWLSLTNGTNSWTDPLNAYLIPEQDAPIDIPISNSSAKYLNYTLAVEPGKKVMFSMTDKGGQGGVSGVNVAGGSEYVSQACLTQQQPYVAGIPTPTSTLSNMRMPDFTATISSTVTGADGSVSTTTSLEQVHGGSIVGAGLDTSQIAGMSVGVAVAAALLAGLATWFIWRRRHGRGIVFWDLPNDADDELTKSRMPIDRNFLKEQGNHRQHSSNSSSNAPMLALSPTSDSSDERDRQRPLAQRAHEGRSFSDASLPDSHSNNAESPTEDGPPLSSTLVGTFPTSSARRVSGGSHTSNPFLDRPPSHGRSQRHRFADIAESEQAYGRAGHLHSSANSYGPSMARGDSSEGMLSEAMPMIETSYLTSSYRGTSNGRTHHAQSDHEARGGMPEYVRHRDAGLLMDDSLEHEDAASRIELPPEYQDVPSSRRRGSNARRSGDNSLQIGSQTLAPGVDLLDRGIDDGDLGGHPLAHAIHPPDSREASLGQRSNAAEIEDEDESEFWRDG